MTKKVRPIQVKKVQIRNIPAGMPFSYHGQEYVMITPICKQDKSLAEVRCIWKRHGVEKNTISLLPAILNNNEMATIPINM